MHAPVPPPRRHRRTWKNPFRRCHLLTANLPPRRAGFFRGSEFRTWSPTACSRASHIFGRPPSRTASRPAACRQRAQSSGSPKQRRYRRACVSVSKCARTQTGTRQELAFLHSSLRHGQTQPLATKALTMSTLPDISLIRGALLAFDLPTDGTHADIHARLGSYLVDKMLRPKTSGASDQPGSSGKRPAEGQSAPPPKERKRRAPSLWIQFLATERAKVKEGMPELKTRADIVREVCADASLPATHTKHATRPDVAPIHMRIPARIDTLTQHVHHSLSSRLHLSPLLSPIYHT